MLEEHVWPFVLKLKELRYSANVVVRSHVVSREFSFYVTGRVSAPEEVSPQHLKEYLQIRHRMYDHPNARRTWDGVGGGAAGSVHLFAKYLATQGVRTRFSVPTKPDLRVVPGYEDLLDEFPRFLMQQRGLIRRSAAVYTDCAGLLCERMVKSGTQSWDDLTPKLLYEHLRSEARRRGHLNLRLVQTALRNFFRFLRLTGRCQKDLTAYLVNSTTFALSRVPKTVEPDVLYRVFDSMRENRAPDIRDRAIFLLITLHGLRIGEVIRLRLEDIRWGEGKLLLRERKGGKDLALPLHPAVARALADYIDHVRPAFTEYREVFLARPGGRPYQGGTNLSTTIRYRIEKLGLNFGPHAIRHSLASRLLNNGCPPEWIQQLLGHANFKSTQIYTKVDLAHLREVADNDGVDNE